MSSNPARQKEEHSHMRARKIDDKWYHYYISPINDGMPRIVTIVRTDREEGPGFPVPYESDTIFEIGERRAFYNEKKADHFLCREPNLQFFNNMPSEELIFDDTQSEKKIRVDFSARDARTLAINARCNPEFPIIWRSGLYEYDMDVFYIANVEFCNEYESSAILRREVENFSKTETFDCGWKQRFVNLLKQKLFFNCERSQRAFNNAIINFVNQ